MANGRHLRAESGDTSGVFVTLQVAIGGDHTGAAVWHPFNGASQELLPSPAHGSTGTGVAGVGIGMQLVVAEGIDGGLADHQLGVAADGAAEPTCFLPVGGKAGEPAVLFLPAADRSWWRTRMGRNADVAAFVLDPRALE